MMSEAEASKSAQEFAARRLAEPGYSLKMIPARQVSETDWAFSFVLVAPEGATGSPQIVLVDKDTGTVRTLREAIHQGWRGEPKG